MADDPNPTPAPTQPAGKKKPAGAKPDIASFAGLLLAAGGILGGLLLEGGKIEDVSQMTAAMIVLGGTLGAVMVTTPLGVLTGAAKRLKLVFLEHSRSPAAIVEDIVAYASKARRNSIVSLESDLDAIDDPFLRKAL